MVLKGVRAVSVSLLSCTISMSSCIGVKGHSCGVISSFCYCCGVCHPPLFVMVRLLLSYTFTVMGFSCANPFIVRLFVFFSCVGSVVVC